MRLDKTTEFSVSALRDGAGISICTHTESTRNSLTIFITLQQLTDLRTLIDAALKKAAEGAP